MKCTDILQHIREIAGLKRLKQRPTVLNHLLDKQRQIDGVSLMVFTTIPRDIPVKMSGDAVIYHFFAGVMDALSRRKSTTIPRQASPMPFAISMYFFMRLSKWWNGRKMPMRSLSSSFPSSSIFP